MHKTLNVDDFRQAFKDYNRGENFSYEGLELLFDYFEELDESCDQKTELDVIAICCEYSEMTKDELLESYEITIHYPSLNTEDEKQDIVQRHLEEHTAFIGKTEVNPFNQKIKSALHEPTFVFQSF
mgnify:CR=1 FL=1|tara:strand:- start:473 stop:850 length:378 start_codon:yes stop_codon:yes gene_type:complete